MINKLEIQRLEGIIKTKLPIEYRNFILKFNGENIEKCIFKKDIQLGTLVVAKLYSIKANKSYNDLEKNYEIYNGRIMDSFIAIGDDPGGNQFCIGIKGTFRDKIYFWDHNEEIAEKEFRENELPKNMYFLAESFDSFINQLEEDKI